MADFRQSLLTAAEYLRQKRLEEEQRDAEAAKRNFNPMNMIGTIGAIVAAPFTGGASLAALPLTITKDLASEYIRTQGEITNTDPRVVSLLQNTVSQGIDYQANLAKARQTVDTTTDIVKGTRQMISFTPTEYQQVKLEPTMGVAGMEGFTTPSLGSASTPQISGKLETPYLDSLTPTNSLGGVTVKEVPLTTEEAIQKMITHPNESIQKLGYKLLEKRIEDQYTPKEKEAEIVDPSKYAVGEEVNGFKVSLNSSGAKIWEKVEEKTMPAVSPSEHPVGFVMDGYKIGLNSKGNKIWEKIGKGKGKTSVDVSPDDYAIGDVVNGYKVGLDAKGNKAWKVIPKSPSLNSIYNEAQKKANVKLDELSATEKLNDAEMEKTATAWRNYYIDAASGKATSLPIRKETGWFNKSYFYTYSPKVLLPTETPVEGTTVEGTAITPTPVTPQTKPIANAIRVADGKPVYIDPSKLLLAVRSGKYKLIK